MSTFPTRVPRVNNELSQSFSYSRRLPPLRTWVCPGGKTLPGGSNAAYHGGRPVPDYGLTGNVVHRHKEWARGIEPTSEAWEVSILPLYDARSLL